MVSALTSRIVWITGTAAAVLAVSGGAYALAADEPPTRGSTSRGELRAEAAQVGGPRLFARFRDAPTTIKGNTNVLTLTLPPGRFLVLGKASFRQDPGQSMTCQLRTSLGDFDETDLRASGQPTRGSFTLTVIRSSSSSESVFLGCFGPDPFGSATDGSLRDMKLTAIEIGDFSNLPG